MSHAKAMQMAYDVFVSSPKNWPDNARRYVNDRKLLERSPFQIGFADESWDRLSNALKAENLQSAGLELGLLGRAESGRYWDMYRNRVIFPIRNEAGTVVGFGGRALGDEKPKYINSAQSALFDKSSLLFGLHEALQMPAAGPINIVEGYTDVLSSIKSGEPAVAPMGTALTAEHLRLIGRHYKSLRMVFDGDVAGREAALRSALLFISEPGDIELAEVTILEEGADPDALYKAGGASKLREGVRDSVSLARFLYQSEFVERDVSTLGLKARAINKLNDMAKSCGVQSVKSELEELIQGAVNPKTTSLQVNQTHSNKHPSAPGVL